MNLEVPVLIVGGGGCGLSSSIFLSDLGIDHLLIERHEGTSHLPKGHYQNQRTMEIMRQHGIADLIYEHGTPMKYMSQVHYRSSIGGTKDYEGKNFFELDAFGGGELSERYTKDSPTPSTNLPQLRLEPLLRQVAEERAPGKVLFHHELVEWSQDQDAVTATILNRKTNEKITVRAKYMIAADGGKSVGPKLGVKMEGPTGLVDMVSVYFKADLSKWMGESPNLITFLPSPEGALCGLVPVGPTWGPQSEEWVLHNGIRPDDPEKFDNDSVVPLLREVLRIPELEPEIIKISHWFIEAVLAEKYRVNRIFLAGDAAHRHPPTTGLGLNTAFQDAHNLTWKLAAVLKGQASCELLDSYEPERRKIGRRNVDWALFSFMNHAILNMGVGLLPGLPKEAQDAALESYFAQNEQGASIRARAAEVFKTQRIEFQAHNIELGFFYDKGALVSENTEPPEIDPIGSMYHPTTLPGHRLPHAWIEYKNQRISTLDLVGKGEFLLISGSSAKGWDEATKEVSKNLGTKIKHVQIGYEGEYSDPTGYWENLSEISVYGAILVRPDHHVAWREKGSIENPTEVLGEVMGRILSIKHPIITKN
jgi:2,4-dichlorophenol 6-monooxygenase